MDAELEEGNARVFAELQELVAIEVRDILATARDEGFERTDVIHALEVALQAEIRALETGGEPLTADPLAE
jgi:hypothetical protein